MKKENINYYDEISQELKENCSTYIDELRKTYIEKNKNYGDSFTMSLEDFGLISAMTRISDKYNRMKNLFKNKDLDPLDEAVDDTMLDMANYLIMTVAFIRRKESENE